MKSFSAAAAAAVESRGDIMVIVELTVELWMNELKISFKLKIFKE